MIGLPERKPDALLADKGYDADAIRADTAQRIQAWLHRTEQWKQQAQSMTQHIGLRQRTRRIDDEQALAQDMNPDRRLVRPLIVVVPIDFAGGN